MEPRDRAAEALRPVGPRGFRLVAGCFLLVGIAFIQDPGFLTSDTKFDLVLDPGGFLQRALHLWDSQGAFGQLQNQAYGYLWPMGPFFWLGALLAIPGWVVQRLWLGLVLSVAFVGAAKLGRALGIRSDLACLMAGFAFALSPRMLTVLGPISIEAWPSAIAPWVLLALVHGSRSGSPRRWAALAASAVAMVGGVNAAATFAVLPLGVIWLLTRAPGPRRRSLMIWWPVFTLLGTLWWLIPLFVMGAYSPPFLDYIETASVTTFPTTLFDALRGTSDWVPYVDSSARAGRDLIDTGYLALNSGVVLLLGFAGLLMPKNAHRRFLALSLLVGVFMVTAGHEGNPQGWLAGPLRELLDGSLAPLRNVHKFDPVIRIPLVLGLAFVVDRILTEVATLQARAEVRGERVPTLVRVNQVVFVGLTVLVVAGSALPAIGGRIAPTGKTVDVPTYWRDTAEWLTTHSADGTALLVPGSAFAEYVWGSPRDEPMQSLAGSRWATRNVVPLTPPGNIRMLDGVEDRLVTGSGSAGLTAYLRRAGVRFLVVRNDLRRADDVPDPVLVHEAIAESPGISLAASFGPEVGGEGSLDGDERRVVVNGGWQTRYPAVQVYEVPGAVSPAVGGPSPATVAGGPEDLLDLLDLGVVGEAPVHLSADTSSKDAGQRPPGGVVLTDGLRAREHFFARIHDGESAALTPGDRPRSGNPVRDYLIDEKNRWSTTVRLEGADYLSASSSMSDSDALGGSRRGNLPFAAVDGDASTSWLSGLGKSDRAWWSIGFEEPISPSTVTLTGGVSDLGAQSVRLRTRNGASGVVRLYPGESREVPLPSGDPISSLTVEDASTAPGRPLSLQQVTVPGVNVRRSLLLPRLPRAWGAPDAIVLRADHDRRTGCASIEGDVRCVEGRDETSEEPTSMRRIVTLADAASYDAFLTVLPRPGAALDDLIFRDQPVRAQASSVAVPDERASALAAIDGDLGTTWTATRGDLRPTLTLNWLGQRRISGLRLATDVNSAARQPLRVSLRWPGGERDVPVGSDGSARFRPFTSDTVRLRVDEAAPGTSLDFDAQRTEIGVGISELRLRGLPFLPLGLSADVRRLPCGSGPMVAVAEESVRTAVVASGRQLAANAPVPARLCGRDPHTASAGVALRSGENELAVLASDAFAPGTWLLGTPDRAFSEGRAATSVVTAAPDPVTRTVRPDDDAAVVGLRENTNAGWEATQEGRRLRPLVLDGWQQGWVLQGSGPVRVRFVPDGAYRFGLALGLAGLVVLLACVVGRWRRRTDDHLAALGTGRLSLPVEAALAIVGAGLVAGWWAAVIAGLLAVPVRALGARDAPPLPWLLAAPLLVAAGAYFVLPWGSSTGWAGNDAWPHYLVLLPLVGVLLPTANESLRRDASGRKLFSLRAGRSTTR